ncbi:MAG: hypothetical protein P4L51_23750 [Puia sp.]|nr:hypothetical protein [Puia sp.]
METVSKHRTNSRKAGATPDRRTSPATKHASRTTYTPETHFLNARFERGYHPNAWPLKEPTLIQQEFFTSAGHLARLHSLTLPDTSAIPFPHNIDTCYRNLCLQLEDIDTDLGLVILQGPGGKVCLTTIKELDLQQNAWYVAVHPLYRECQQPVSDGYRQLLLAILQFLIEKIGYAPYWVKHTFMADNYEATRRSFDENKDEEEEEAVQEWRTETALIEQVGKYFQEQLQQPRPSLTDLLQRYRPISARGKALQKLATRFARHEQRYPLRHLAREIPAGWLQPGVEERLPSHYFFCLVYDYTGLFPESVNASIDSEFQEACVFDIPIGMQHFERRQSRIHHDLRYEEACLQLIEQFEHFLTSNP